MFTLSPPKCLVFECGSFQSSTLNLIFYLYIEVKLESLEFAWDLGLPRRVGPDESCLGFKIPHSRLPLGLGLGGWSC